MHKNVYDQEMLLRRLCGFFKNLKSADLKKPVSKLHIYLVWFQSMAGGVISQVQGIIPGMRREEEVPDPAQPQEEYQEYQVMLGRQIYPLI